MGDEKDMGEAVQAKEPKKHIDRDTARLMKDAGMKKPEDVSTTSWRQVENLDKPKYHTVAYLAAKGCSVKEIAHIVHMSQGHIRILLASEQLQFEIKRLQYRLFGKDAKKRFNDLLPTAIDALQSVLEDKSAKSAVKLQAAIYATDRAMGKPKQSIEVEGSLIRDLLDKINGTTPRTIDAEGIRDAIVVPRRNPNEVVPIDTESNPNFDKDPIDDWSEQYLK